MKALILWILLFSITGFALNAKANEPTDSHTIELTNYVTYLFRNMRPKFLKKALKYVPIVVQECKNQHWDPLLIGMIIKKESSWRSGIISKSSLKEKGLMQLHGKAARGWNLDDPYQEIQGGVTWLSECRATCGNDLKRVLSCYGTGSCNKHDLPAIQRRIRAYKRIVTRFRIR